MNPNVIQNFLLGPSLLFLGVFGWREDLFRIIRSESRSASVSELLAQSFTSQDCDSLMAAVFHKMAAEEQRQAAILEWFYRKRFGPLPSTTEALTVDSKILNQTLHAGVQHLIQEKVAANRRVSGPPWKRVMRIGLSFFGGIKTPPKTDAIPESLESQARDP